MTVDNSCVLCDPALGPIVAEHLSWRLVLNRNQDLLGKCFLALRRHEERVVSLTAEEWAELQQAVLATTAGIHALLHPEHFNYAFLQNRDRHVHFHVIPRYATPRQFAGETWLDPAFRDHYPVGSAPRTLPPVVARELTEALQQAMRTSTE